MIIEMCKTVIARGKNKDTIMCSNFMPKSNDRCIKYLNINIDILGLSAHMLGHSDRVA